MTGGWVFPQSLRVSHSANEGRPGHVIRGVKLEFSSEARSPSADFFLFRPLKVLSSFLPMFSSESLLQGLASGSRWILQHSGSEAAVVGTATGDSETCCNLCSSKLGISSWGKAISSILRYTTSPGLLRPSERLHGKLVLLLRRVRTGSSFGVWGVPRVVGALVESPSVKASISGDWGELSMWQAVSAFWYCCRVIFTNCTSLRMCTE